MISYESQNILRICEVLSDPYISNRVIDVPFREKSPFRIGMAFLNFFNYTMEYFSDKDMTIYLFDNDEKTPCGIMALKNEGMWARVDIGFKKGTEGGSCQERLNLCIKTLSNYALKNEVKVVYGRIRKDNKPSRLFAKWGGFKEQQCPDDEDIVIVKRGF